MTVTLMEYRKVSQGLETARRLLGPNTVFVVPTREDGRILREALSAENPADPAHSPWTMSEFYRKTLSGLEEAGGSPQWQRQVDPPDHWAILSFLLDRVFEEAGETDAPPPGARMPGFIPLLGEQLRELLREEATPETLGLSLGCGTCPEGSPCRKLSTPEGLLCRLFHAYGRYLPENGLADSASLPTLARRALEENPQAAAGFLAGKRFVFAGFLSFTHAQAALVRHLHRMGVSVSVLKPAVGLAGFADAIDQLIPLTDRTGPALELSSSRDEPFSVFDLSSGNTPMEPDTAARALALWNAGDGPLAAFPFPGWDGIAIQAPSSEAALFASSLARYRIPFCEADGLAVSATAPWAFAAAVLDAAGAGWPPLETAALLASFLAAGDLLPLSGTLSTSPRGEKGWSLFLGRLADRAPAEAFSRAAAFSRVVERGATPVGLLGALKALWKSPGISGGRMSRLAERHPDLDLFVRQAHEALRELDRKILLEQERYPSIGPARDRVLRKAQARAYLSEWAEETTVRPPSSLAGTVALFGKNPPVWFFRPCFILAGCTAKTWPGPLKEAPLLCDAARRILNETPPEGMRFRLPLMADRRLQQEALFRRLLATGESLAVLSRAESDGQGRPLDATPFFETSIFSGWGRLAGRFFRPVSAALPREGEPVFPQIEPRAGEPRVVRKPLPPAAARDPGPAPHASLGELDTWLDCPFRYWALRLADLDEPARGLFDPARAGTFLHTLWQEVWKRRLSGPRETLASLVEELWEPVILDPDERRGYPTLGLDPRLSRRKRRLKELALRLAALQEETEQVFEPRRTVQHRERSMTLEVGGVNFRGRADRVEVFEGGFIVLDYKSGRIAPYKRSLQLAAYSVALEDLLGLPSWGTGILGHADGRLYLALSDDCPLTFPRGNGITAAKPKTLEASLERAREGLSAMARGILSGSFPAAHRTASACPHCPARGLCRLGEARGESLAAEEETEGMPDE
ncbi:MAG: PD-(D/E)XK nuclease family protein [Synergistales bacterium]